MTYLREKAVDRFPMFICDKKDHKAWAKRILWREEMKDPELLPIQVKFAKEAMENTAVF